MNSNTDTDFIKFDELIKYMTNNISQNDIKHAILISRAYL